MGAISRGVRNIYRSKIRATIVMILLGLGIGIFITMAQASTGVQGATGQLRTEFQNLIVVRAAGSTEMGLGAELLPDTLINELRTIPGIADVENILYWRILDEARNPAISVTVGVTPGDEIRLATHGSVGSPTIILGRGFQPEDGGKNVVIVGQLFAKNWTGIDVDRLLRERPSDLGSLSINGTEFKIIGIFSSGFAFGDNQVILPYDVAQRLYPQLQGKVTNIYVRVNSVENLRSVVNGIKAKFGDRVDVIAGLNRVQLILSSLNRIGVSSSVGSLLATAVSALVIISVMVLVVNERTREIGTLKAIGASNGDIAKQFIAEPLTLAIFGGIIGFAIFSAIGPFLASQILGIVTGEPLAAHIETPISGINISFNPAYSTILLGATFILGLGVLGSLYPALKAAKMDPADALRAR